MSDKPDSSSLSADKQTLLALRRMRARIDELERAQTEPIAIVGVGCRFPGGADGPEAYWRLLRDGQDAIAEVPRDRWDIDAFYDPDPEAPGKMYTRYGGFIALPGEFDARFFSISPREAVSIDPQHRLILEVSWEALENAGQNADRLQGEPVGVFVGISTGDYGMLHVQRADPALVDSYFGSGNAPNAAAGRVSYTLGLQGPSLAVDTACSSSLVAVHLACQSLRSGDCRMALAGGVNLILAPEITINFSRARMMAPDGRCKTFDAAADGYVRGEGCGIVVLKRLSDALADRDRVLAVVRGSAVNQDGRSSGFTAPNELAQEQVIRQALRTAKLEPSEVQYLEAHGTGTSLGDPIEVQAAAAAYGEGRAADAPLKLGSVKTNVGHLEAAAGIAGLIKLVLSLQHNEIPPHLHFNTPNPYIPWADLPVEVVRERTPWARGAKPRAAGVSSFGFSGTNAHIIVGDPPVVPEARPRGVDRPGHVLALSARSGDALRHLAGRYAAQVADADPAALPDICYTANAGRAQFGHRLAVAARSTSELREALERYSLGESSPGVAAGEALAGGVVFLFTGQGSQYPGMARQLFETQPAFRATLERCDEILAGRLDRSLRSVIYPDGNQTSQISETAYTQPALFAVEYALAELWRSWGIQPAAVIGHSIGEYVAACVAGVIGLEDALLAVAARGRLMQTLPAGGAMAAVFADHGRIRPALAGFEDRVAVAAVNAPENTVISGAVDAVEAVLAKLSRRGITGQRLDVSHAFHSPQMEPMLDAFEREIAGQSFRPPRMPIVSNLTGQIVPAGFSFDASYWRRHAREAVRFADGIRALLGRGHRLFLEVGPSPTLASFGRAVAGSSAATWAASLRRGRDDWDQMLSAVGDLYVHGAAIDWAGFDRDYVRHKVTLPTYPFERERYWIDLPEPARRPQAAEPIYEITWREQPRTTAGPPDPAAATWVVFEDRDGVGAAVCTRMREAGARVLAVKADATSAPVVSPDEVTIDPRRPEQFAAIWKALEIGGAPQSLHLLYLWPLDVSDAETGAGMQTAAVAACGALLHLFQSLSSASRVERARVTLVTRSAQPVRASDRLTMSQAPALSLLTTMAREFPEIACGSVDLEPGSTEAPEESDALLREIAEPSPVDRVAFRGRTRYVARLRALTVPLAPEVPIRADGSYVITGGLGALGLMVARRLVARGARHLTLVGRRDPSAAARAAIRELEESGAAVTHVRADIANDADVARFVAEIQRDRPPLRGVVHAAGIRDDGVVGQQTSERFGPVLAPKVAGSWNLHARTRELPLDFFVLFSSSASVFGSPGQVNYAAANGFLAALAHERRRLGLPATSIAWGPWAEGGMAAGVSNADRQRWARVGLDLIQPGPALDWLGRLAATPVASTVVLPVKWPRFAEQAGEDLRALLDELVPRESAAVAAVPSQAAGADFRAELERTPRGRRRAALEAHVRDHVRQVLALAPSARLGDSDGFRDLGMDSLMAVDLRNRLQRALSCTLPATVAFDHPTVDALADYLGGQVLDAFSPQTPEVQPQVTGSSARSEPIAVVGLGCRFPGGASDPQLFWQLLHEGVDAITEVPAERWDVDAFYDADPDAPGKMCTRWGGFLEGIDRFDPRFFGMSPRETVSLDPQQRLLLEVSWEALEHAGQRPDGLRGSATGVFVGISGNEYVGLPLSGRTLADLDAYAGTGNAPSMAAGRLSFTMGLQGPSLAVDTACSSSLVAVHLACQSLRQGECRLALAGGVNLILNPATNVVLSRARMMAADGKCKTFDASADGYVRGEGCGIVVLKRLADAVADGDRVLAVIRGTAVNQDGRTSGLTVPNGPAQEALIRAALAQAGVTPDDVSYVEAHGTGTSLGDPIEVHALGAVLCVERDAASPLRLGSVKTNLGHLEAAAGIAGLIKTVLALQHEEIPPHLHLTTPNPLIAWDTLAVEAPTTPVPWRRGDRPRIAGVSSFGFSGTNAHLVMEEAPAVQPRDDGRFDRPRHVLSLSAKTGAALRALAGRYVKYLQTESDANVADICFTANSGRAHLEHRLAAVGSSIEELLPRLEAFVADRRSPGLLSGRTDLSTVPAVAFSFGNDAVQSGGVRELYETQPAFRQALDRCASILGGRIDPSLRALVSGDGGSSLMVDSQHAPLAQFAVQYSLAELWRSWGIVPSAVTGRGAGEYVAACVAGVFSVEAGVQLAMAHADPQLLERAAAGVTYQAPQIEVTSSDTNASINEAVATAAYWMRERPAESAGARDAMSVLPDADLHLDLGARTADWERLLESLIRVYVEGASIDWAGFDRGYPRRKLALPTYPFQRERYWVDGGSDSQADATYEVTWRPSEALAQRRADSSSASDRWMIFADRDGVGAALGKTLEAQGMQVTTVLPAPRPGVAADVCVAPGDRDGFRKVFKGKTPGHEPSDVAFLWPLDGASEAGASVDAVERAQVECCHGLLHLAQALIERTGTQPRLWIVTRDAQPVGQTPGLLAVSQSPVWGFGRVLSLEHPELSVRLIDLESQGVEQEAAVLASEVSHRDGEDLIALRGSSRLVARLVAAGPLSGSPVRWSSEATYLITGGLGSLGLRVASWMVDHGARRLVLIGRHGLPRETAPASSAATAIAALERQGADVTVVGADVADAAAMGRLFDDLRSAPSPIRGVVHAAGVTSLTEVAHLDAAALDGVLRSKVVGGWLLHRLTESLTLDFFVMFSSIASVWGARGLASYAAANQFLDALAHHRRALGLPALSVNWGPWNGGGMTSAEARDGLGLIGVDALEPKAALERLDGLMAASRTQATVATVDWNVFKPIYAAKAAHHFLDLVGTATARAEAPRQDQTAAVLERLRAAHRGERQMLLEAWTQEELAAVLGKNLAGAPEPDARFFDLGMDSLTSVELRRRLERRLGCVLEPTLVFDFPTVERLAAHLADRLGVGAPSTPRSPAIPAPDDPMRRVSEMSDEDIERLFAERVLNQGT